MTKMLTNSEMALWTRCKRKWWLSQHRGLRPRDDNNFNKPLGVGTRVHDALANYYDPAIRADPVAWIQESIRNDLNTYPLDAVDIAKEGALCEAMISGYVEWLAETGADQAMTVIASETALHVALVDSDGNSPGVDGTRILSKLDARVQHDELGGRYALEHKTAGSIKPPAELRINRQFLTEHLVEFLTLKDEGREGEGAVGVLWNALLKSKRTARAKGPFYAREAAKHNDEQLRNHWRHVWAIASEIAGAEARLSDGESPHSVCYPTPTATCSWDCPFIRVCASFDDGSDAEGHIAARFETGDPLQRYQGLLPQEGTQCAS